MTQKTIEIQLYTYSELSGDSKERAMKFLVEDNYKRDYLNCIVDDDFLFTPEGYSDLLLIVNPSELCFDIDRNWYLQIGTPKITSLPTFFTWLKVPERMREYVNFEFIDNRRHTTAITLSLEDDYEEEGSDSILRDAEEIFNSHMQDSLIRIRKAFEWYYSEKYLTDEAMSSDDLYTAEGIPESSVSLSMCDWA